MVSSSVETLSLLKKWQSESSKVLLAFIGNSASLQFCGRVTIATLEQVTVSTIDNASRFSFILKNAQVVLSDPRDAKPEIRKNIEHRIGPTLIINLPRGAVPGSPKVGEVIICEDFD